MHLMTRLYPDGDDDDYVKVELTPEMLHKLSAIRHRLSVNTFEGDLQLFEMRFECTGATAFSPNKKAAPKDVRDWWENTCPSCSRPWTVTGDIVHPAHCRELEWDSTLLAANADHFYWTGWVGGELTHSGNIQWEFLDKIKHMEVPYEYSENE